MKITHKAANTYGYIAIAVMFALLIMVLLKVVPQSWYYPLFAVALALYLVRITLRLILARQARLDQRGKDGAAGETSDQADETAGGDTNG